MTPEALRAAEDLRIAMLDRIAKIVDAAPALTDAQRVNISTILCAGLDVPEEAAADAGESQ